MNMERIKSFVSQKNDANVYKYEQLLNQEMIGAGGSPLTPNFHRRNVSYELEDFTGDKRRGDNTKKNVQLETKKSIENPFEMDAFDDENINDSLDLIRDDFTNEIPPTNLRRQAENTTVPEPQGEDKRFRIADVNLSFFSSRFKPKMKQLLKSFLQIYSLMIFLIIGIGSIYYGSLYNRGYYLQKNIKIGILNDDQTSKAIKPLVGTAMEFITNNDQQLRAKVQFEYYSALDFTDYMGLHNLLAVTEALERKVLQREAWAYVYVTSNSTEQLFRSLKTGDGSYFSNSNVIHMYYQSTRDPKIVNGFLKPILTQIEHLYQESFQTRVMIPFISEWIEASQLKTLLDSHKEVLFLSIRFEYHDLRPFSDPVLAGPLTVGLIMMTIVSFFQFNFFMPIHNIVAANLNPRHYIYYRMVSSQTTYFCLALGFTSLFYIFSMKKLDFFPYWLVTYLAIAAVGGMNENMALILFVTYPPLVGFWLIFWVFLNVSPSFNLIETLPAFYRYGYALPIYNYLECVKVIILNSWDGQLYRNILILAVWVVLNNLLFPFTIMFFSYRMARKMAQEENS